MKHRKIAVAALLCAALVCGLFLTACTGTVTEVKDLEASLDKAARDYLADYVKNNITFYSYDGAATRIDSVEADDIIYTVKGVVGLQKATGAAASADFDLTVEFINFAGQTTATFRMLDAHVGDPH